MDSQKISVIIPAYNAGSWIERCVESVFHQTWRNIEIIVINDGSIDDTLEKLELLKISDNRLIVIDKSNEGVVKARNVGVEKATGEYLVFLDADDYLPKNALCLMASRLNESCADLCVGGFTLVWEANGHKVMVNHRKRFVTAKDCFKYCMAHGEMFLAIKMFRTQLYKRVVRIPFDVIIQEDVIGLTQYFQHVSSVTYVNESVYFYVKRAQSVTGKFSSRHISSLLKVADFLRCNQFAMSMPSVVNRHCAEIAHCCLMSPFLSEVDCKKAEQLRRSLPASARLSAKLKIMKGDMKAFVKMIIHHHGTRPYPSL